MNCPICKKKAQKQFYPFCSLDCKHIDLYNWFNDKYVYEKDSTEFEKCGSCGKISNKNKMHKSPTNNLVFYCDYCFNVLPSWEGIND